MHVTTAHVFVSCTVCFSGTGLTLKWDYLIEENIWHAANQHLNEIFSFCVKRGWVHSGLFNPCGAQWIHFNHWGIWLVKHNIAQCEAAAHRLNSFAQWDCFDNYLCLAGGLTYFLQIGSSPTDRATGPYGQWG